MRLIDEDAVIGDIDALLKSPYANYCHRVNDKTAKKDMAETIRELCVRSSPTAYDVESVSGLLERRAKIERMAAEGFPEGTWKRMHEYTARTLEEAAQAVREGVRKAERRDLSGKC